MVVPVPRKPGGKQPPPWVTAGEDVSVPSPNPEAKNAKARRKREPKEMVRAGMGYTESAAGDKKCGAKKDDYSFCGLSAGWGTDHVGYGPCKWHLGSTEEGKKSAATEMAEELMVFYGAPIETNPIQALLDEVSRTAGHVAWLAQRIGKFNVPINFEEVDEKGVRHLRVMGLPPEVEGWLRVYLSERAQLVRVSKAALDAGVNERLVRIAEYQGEKLADAVETILKQLGLTAAQQALVPSVVPNVLRQLTAGGPILEGETVE